MFFRIYSPAATIFSFVTAGVLSRLGGHRHKSRRRREVTPYVPKIQRVIDAHRDCTAELFNIFVRGRKRANAFAQLSPGDMLEVKLDGDSLEVWVGNIKIASAEIPATSLLPKAFQSGADIYAYLGGRDLENASDTAEFGTVVVFYKLEDVPPTKINLQF